MPHIHMSHSIILQYPYETIQIGLCQNDQIISTVTEHKFNAIRLTIPHIQTLLKQQNLTLKDLNFVAVKINWSRTIQHTARTANHGKWNSFCNKNSTNSMQCFATFVRPIQKK